MNFITRRTSLKQVGRPVWRPPGGLMAVALGLAIVCCTARPSHADTTTIDLPTDDQLYIDELLASVSLDFRAQGYDQLADKQAPLPPLPDHVERKLFLHRSTETATEAIRIGVRSFRTRHDTLWIEHWQQSNNEWQRGDSATVAKAVQGRLTSLPIPEHAIVAVRDMASRPIKLSYAAGDHAIEALMAHGITVIAKPSDTPRQVAVAELPIVVRLPSPGGKQTGLVGERKGDRDKLGLTMMPSVASQIESETISSPIGELLVIYDPDKPQQFNQVYRHLADVIDRPADQVLIEGLVLEISEEGIQELGVEWQLQKGHTDALFGTIALDSNPSASVNVADSSSLESDWTVRLRTLLRTGKAQILSRPSILTLDNRQATIRVGQDIPIANSGSISNSNKLSFSFRYIPTGILLNVKPRVSADRETISLSIDTTVSAVVPGNDLEILDSDDTVLASAPTLSTRSVQTYARIANNTPFIIGGLVSRDSSSTEIKTPLLGDLPAIGRLFRSTRTDNVKREVIIVLTPYVLSNGQSVVRTLPGDVDLANSEGNALYSSSYRIRGGDVPDLAFIRDNAALRDAQARAQAAVNADIRLASMPPFSTFIDGNFPGEGALVRRMLYNIIRQQESAKAISSQQLIYMKAATDGGYDIAKLDERLAQLYEATDQSGLGPSALAITFESPAPGTEAAHELKAAIPQVRELPCEDRESWSQLLLTLNNGRRNSILLQNHDDVVRLQQAVMMKLIIQRNGGADKLSLQQFQVGRHVLMPEVTRHRRYLIDIDVARCFFATKHHYTMVTRTIAEEVQALNERLDR